MLLLGRKVLTNLDNALKSRDITSPTKVHIVKAMVFPVVMKGIRPQKGWALNNWCIRTVVLEKTLESPLDSKGLKPVNPKGNQPWIFIGSDATQSCPAVCNPIDSAFHGILQTRILEWVAFPFFKGSSQPRDRTQAFHIAGGVFINWAIREAHLLEELTLKLKLQ